MTSPDLFSGITDDFLPLKYVTPAGPIIIAVQKAAIQFDPPGSEPESDAEWNVVKAAILQAIEPRLPDLCDRYDSMRRSGVSRWMHLDLTADRLVAEDIVLRTCAHHMLRQATYQPH
jgi:hypothetical protein